VNYSNCQKWEAPAISKGFLEKRQPEAKMNANENQITLPSSPKDLSEFILKLLGTGNTIRRYISGFFLVKLDNLIDLHQKIEHRIAQQNSGHLTSFEAEFSFEDDHSFKVRTVEELKTFNPIRSENCHSAILTWIYLVRFKDRSPERQRITVQLDTDANGDIDGRTNPAKIAYLSHYRYASPIKIEIEHTEVSFGYDMDHLITSALKKFVTQNTSTTKKLFERHEIALPTVVILATFAFVFSAASSLFYSHMNSIAPLDSELDLSAISNKLDFIIAKSQSYALLYFFGILATTTALASVTIASLARLARTSSKSWLLLNDHQIRLAKDYETLTRKSKKMSFVYLVGSLAATVFNKSIYDFGKFLYTTFFGS
jgi:hypothetical protein